MKKSIQKNTFLDRLLELQQDGKGAISAPKNWEEDALLKIPVEEIDQTIDELSKEMLHEKDGKENTVARWHFFIGSPGNGKSVAVAGLRKKLIDDRKCKIEIDKNDLQIPYEIEVKEKGRKDVTALIVQDASVVKKPYEIETPADVLEKTLEDAWNKQISLVICANRGVLENVYHKNLEEEKGKWFEIIKEIVEKPDQDDELSEQDFESKKGGFLSVKPTRITLENASLLLEKSYFEDLIEEAIKEENWSDCLNCSLEGICPFKANRDWLLDEHARKNFLKVLLRAELLSEQIIVFREAVALISFILAGCSEDYKEKGISSPCSWVGQREKEFDYFSLAMRRIYMCIFSSYSKFGLDFDFHKKKELSRQKRKLLELFKELKNEIELRNKSTDKSGKAGTWKKENQHIESLKSISKNESPSTDVGVKRLTSYDGIFSQIDPIKRVLDEEFSDLWDFDLEEIKTHFENEMKTFPTKLEEKCLEIWISLENFLENFSSDESVVYYESIKTWTSNFMIRFGSLYDGRTYWEDELDDFATLKRSTGKEVKDREEKEQEKVKELRELITKDLPLIGNLKNSDVGFQLSTNVTLEGESIKQKYKPVPDLRSQDSTIPIRIKFGEDHQTFLSARAYLWLRLKHHEYLNVQSIPRDLFQSMIRTRLNALSYGDEPYSHIKDNIKITIQNLKNENEKPFEIGRDEEGAKL